MWPGEEGPLGTGPLTVLPVGYRLWAALCPTAKLVHFAGSRAACLPCSLENQGNASIQNTAFDVRWDFAHSGFVLAGLRNAEFIVQMYIFIGQYT